MKVIIQIDTGNAAFEDYPSAEVARMLHRLADMLEHNPVYEIDGSAQLWNLYDLNGNCVGEYRVQ